MAATNYPQSDEVLNVTFEDLKKEDWCKHTPDCDCPKAVPTFSRLLMRKRLLMKKSKRVRIIERIHPCGRVQYIIQQKHFLFRWRWVDAWLNSMCGASCQDYFDSLEEAKANLCFFDGTKCKETAVLA